MGCEQDFSHNIESGVLIVMTLKLLVYIIEHTVIQRPVVSRTLPTKKKYRVLDWWPIPRNLPALKCNQRRLFHTMPAMSSEPERVLSKSKRTALAQVKGLVFFTARLPSYLKP